MTDRERVLGALPAAEGHIPPPSDYRLGMDELLWAEARDAYPNEIDALWMLFWKRARGLGMKQGWPVADPVAAWFVDAPVEVPSEVARTNDVWSAHVGVSSAVCAIAETGSLLVSGGHRLASLAPPVHVVALQANQIVLRLEDALLKLPSDNAVLITGPSRTADIEGVMVNGAHGPRELWVVVLP